MDILIKGLALPKGEGMGRNIVLMSDGSVWTGGAWEEKIDGVKAVALPEHGRLIDADELEDILDEVNGYGCASEITYKKMIEILHDETLTPTIVEATE